MKKSSQDNSGFSRERLSLEDLKQADVMTKIKQRCMATNPGSFDEQGRFLSKSQTKITNKSNFKSLESIKSLETLKAMGTIKTTTHAAAA